MIAFMWVLRHAIERHERAAERERALARAGSDLVASRDREGISMAALEGIQAIVSPHAQPEAIVAFGDSEQLSIIGATSRDASPASYGTVDLSALPAIRARLLRGEPYEVNAREIALAASQVNMTTTSQTAFVLPIMTGATLCGGITVMTPSSLPDECKSSLQTLATEVALGLQNLDLREQLTLHYPIELPAVTQVFVTASIGIAFGVAEDTVQAVLSRADVAMYTAKRNGKSRWAVFEPTLGEDAAQRFELDSRLALRLKTA